MEQFSSCELSSDLHAIVAAAGGTGEAPLANWSELGVLAELRVLAEIAAAAARSAPTKRSTLVAMLELAAVAGAAVAGAARVAAAAEAAVAGVAEHIVVDRKLQGLIFAIDCAQLFEAAMVNRF